ncbi:MAG: hypothetical protein Q8R28_22020, partial [Dehalococcoidia bacterium]|nr:hypothetical protein [Dehalococcoidia bacterium]
RPETLRFAQGDMVKDVILSASEESRLARGFVQLSTSPALGSLHIIEYYCSRESGGRLWRCGGARGPALDSENDFVRLMEVAIRND